tara:strand:+ start:572 stop:745 length:174 start_codon:yes stop_codon:yes gene_type:complete
MPNLLRSYLGLDKEPEPEPEKKTEEKPKPDPRLLKTSKFVRPRKVKPEPEEVEPDAE